MILEFQKHNMAMYIENEHHLSWTKTGQIDQNWNQMLKVYNLYT